MKCLRVLLGLMLCAVLLSNMAFAEVIYGVDTANYSLVLKDAYGYVAFLNQLGTRNDTVLYAGELRLRNQANYQMYVLYSQTSDAVAYRFDYSSYKFLGVSKSWGKNAFIAMETYQASYSPKSIAWTIIKGGLGTHQIESAASAKPHQVAESVPAFSLLNDAYRPGQRMGVKLTLPVNTLAASTADAYLVGISPEGKFYSINAQQQMVYGMTPMIQSWTVTALENAMIVTPSLSTTASAGTWKWILTFTQPGGQLFVEQDVLLSLSTSCTVSGEAIDPNTAVIGALVPQTGSLADLGASITSVLQQAQNDVNAYLISNGLPHRVELVIKDSAGDPYTALVAAKSLMQESMPSIIVGPATSEETTYCMEATAPANVVLVSPSATATSLSLPNDNLVRLTMDDSQQVAAITALLQKDGITTIVPFCRNDAYTMPLLDSLTASFTAAGGTVTTAISYTGRDDSSVVIPERMASLSETVSPLHAGTTAILFLTVGETVEVFTEATKYAALSNVRWYASDSLAQSSAILADNTASAFAVKVKLTSPLPSFAATDFSTRIDAALVAEGLTPRTYAHLYYDAFVLSALTMTLDTTAVDALSIRKGLNGMTGVYTMGATGTISLNANDDRASGSYTFWQVTHSESGAAAWAPLTIWNSETALFE